MNSNRWSDGRRRPSTFSSDQIAPFIYPRVLLIRAVGLFQTLASNVGRWTIGVGGNHSLIFASRQITFLLQIVHLPGSQVPFLQILAIGLLPRRALVQTGRPV